MNKTLFILGGTGFIGHEVLIQAVQAGWHVKALVRSEEGANKLQQVGAHPIKGDISRPETWIAEARGNTALIDLTQPKFPKRLSRSAMKSLSAERQAMTRTTLEALQSLSAEERPIFFSVSGADDLQPDAQGSISERSPLHSYPRGFAHIGIPVHRLVEASGIEAMYVYLGNLVYGPGKVFSAWLHSLIALRRHSICSVSGKASKPGRDLQGASVRERAKQRCGWCHRLLLHRQLQPVFACEPSRPKGAKASALRATPAGLQGGCSSQPLQVEPGWTSPSPLWLPPVARSLLLGQQAAGARPGQRVRSCSQSRPQPPPTLATWPSAPGSVPGSP